MVKLPSSFKYMSFEEIIPIIPSQINPGL